MVIQIKQEMQTNIECPAYTDLRKGDEILIMTDGNDKPDTVVIESSEVDDEEVHITFRYDGVLQKLSFNKEYHEEQCFGYVMLKSRAGEEIYRRTYTSKNAMLAERKMKEMENEKREQERIRKQEMKHTVDRCVSWMLTDPLLKWGMKYL